MATGEISKRFGKAVRQRRLAAGWSQETLAEAAGLHATYISGVERGRRNPTLDVAGRIAAALDVSLPTLLEEAQRKSNGK